MSIIGEGKYVNYVGTEMSPSWHKYERFDYCEKPVRKDDTLTSVFKNLVKIFGSSKAAA